VSGPFARATSRLVAAGLRGATVHEARRFDAALAHPDRAQATRLAAVLATVRGTRQAMRLGGIERVRTPREFQLAVPLANADGRAGDLEDIRRGARHVLTRDRVIRIERTGGSSGPSKDVAYTRGLMAEFHAALLPWLHDIAMARPRACEGPSYWSISPLAGGVDVTEAGIPMGAEEDAEYFPPPLRRLLARVFAVPGSVARLPDVASCRYVTLRCLIEAEELAFVSVWNPSFLTLLVDAMDEHAERLLDDLERGTCRVPPAGDGVRDDRDARIRPIVAGLALRARPGRARELRAHLRSEGRVAPTRVWPSLALVSLWADAHAARCVPDVRRRFPGVELQGKGLLATEGVVSLPLFRAPAPVLAVNSHFYEFLDPAVPYALPRLAHEVEFGRAYEVAITTSGGLLRYRLGDLVRVEGFVERTPCLRFMGRADTVVDLVGEKLSSVRAGRVIAHALEAAPNGIRPRFVMLAPAWGEGPGYDLYVESEAPDEALHALAARVEDGLCEGFAYRYARELGQLGPVVAVRVHDALPRYEARCVASGQRAGSIKPIDLHPEDGWHAWFGVAADPSAGARQRRTRTVSPATP
jgi:hypothetical protein